MQVENSYHHESENLETYNSTDDSNQRADFDLSPFVDSISSRQGSGRCVIRRCNQVRTDHTPRGGRGIMALYMRHIIPLLHLRF